MTKLPYRSVVRRSWGTETMWRWKQQFSFHPISYKNISVAGQDTRFNSGSTRKQPKWVKLKRSLPGRPHCPMLRFYFSSWKDAFARWPKVANPPKNKPRKMFIFTILLKINLYNSTTTWGQYRIRESLGLSNSGAVRAPEFSECVHTHEVRKCQLPNCWILTQSVLGFICELPLFLLPEKLLVSLLASLI